MAGTQTYIRTKSGSQLLYLTSGLPGFAVLPKDSITGERIEGAFANTSFKPKIRTSPELAEQVVAITGPVSTEAQIRAAFATLKAKHQGKVETKPSPKKATAKAAPKRTSKTATPKMPTEMELKRAQFDAAMKIMTQLRDELGIKVA